MSIFWRGIIYPDRVASAATSDLTSRIKSHHNVGALPDEMKLRLIDPIRDLYKDEVRAVAKKLDLLENIVKYHPFPGHGLAARIIEDKRSLGHIAIIRAVESVESMAADFAKLPYDLLARIGSRITNKISGVTWVPMRSHPGSRPRSSRAEYSARYMRNHRHDRGYRQQRLVTRQSASTLIL